MSFTCFNATPVTSATATNASSQLLSQHQEEKSLIVIKKNF